MIKFHTFYRTTFQQEYWLNYSDYENEAIRNCKPN
ncbi:unnamed protein product [Paramecium octaurelia]|uniref:Uncharacterized protein n=1 Tax=Paramecium octaurelia TaxID=43137 RepID=A0A8S1U3U0_PAROT|nr:unnamed protein product [Paramecium octaurelia]